MNTSMLVANKNMFYMSERQLEQIKYFFTTLLFACSLILVLSLLNDAIAATSAGADDEFKDVLARVTKWTTGSMGKAVAIAFVVVGIIGGIIAQRINAFVIGIGAALGLSYTPTLVGSIFTATL
ncbi:conjugal transfer protein TraA [Photobacterium damselae subsp. damselae]|uniref:Conjugal transfer protein TraA n=1 Tax=Photobacterium damselae subsp. damselae TaxID=85581 RepID=A0A850QPY3_PHODD|nr:conjugal transfer protein TraA [Photobacterium damselae subsp. damselae]